MHARCSGITALPEDSFRVYRPSHLLRLYFELIWLREALVPLLIPFAKTSK